MARSLLACVLSTTGRRNASRNCVPTARSSYAAHASYMQVWTTANTRAAIGAPIFASRTPCSVVVLHWTTTFSTCSPLDSEKLERTMSPPDLRTATTNKRIKVSSDGVILNLTGPQGIRVSSLEHFASETRSLICLILLL